MNSIWAVTASMPQFPALDGSVQTDVLIIGGGIAGILCAHQLQQQGISCIVAESDRICCGITKNTTAKITSQHGLIYHKLTRKFGTEKAKLYLEANEGALSEFRKLCQDFDCDFEDQDSFVYLRADPKKLEEELNALNRLHFPAQLASDLPLPFSTVGAVKFPGQAQFHPLKFLAELSRPLTVFENTRVKELVGTTAVTDLGNIHARKVIVATHFPFINKHGSYFLKMYQHRSYVIALKNAPKLQGMYIDGSNSGYSFRTHKDLLLLGGGAHRTGKTGGGWQELESLTASHYPHTEIIARWATQDCMTLDGIPYIGHYSKRTPDLYVATGFNKWGMTTSMVAAKVLSDLIQKKNSPYWDIFSPSRSMLHPQLAANALEASVNLLTPGKRCPHMGCALKWNPQERTWDCPCHGSRFTKDGTCIDNPATGNLKHTSD